MYKLIIVKFKLILMKIIFILTIIWTQCKDYKYYSYDHIHSIFKELSKTCSQYIKVTDSQTEYGLSDAGMCGDSGCKTLIVHMTDFNTFTVDRPQVWINYKDRYFYQVYFMVMK